MDQGSIAAARPQSATSLEVGSKVLLVTNHLEDHPKGGREMLCRLNHDLLRDLFGDRLFVFHLQASNGRLGLGEALRGYVDGVCFSSIRKILSVATQIPGLKYVFIDGSNLGPVAVAIKASVPHIEVITFFHNVESRFFIGSLLARRSVRAAGVLLANYLAERKAVHASDKRICLSERDSRILSRFYGCGATHISPISLKDTCRQPGRTAESTDDDCFALFVGGTFYANRKGIEWYVDHVAPQCDVKVFVVGRGFESLRSRLEVPGRVEVIGGVDDLSEWYRRARFAIAPIFDGSGMKTKVAEALMYGKRVVGTPEAFSGYEEVLPAAGWVCLDPKKFAVAMQAARASIKPGSDPVLRGLFGQKYSEAAARARMRSIIGGREQI